MWPSILALPGALPRHILRNRRPVTVSMEGYKLAKRRILKEGKRLSGHTAGHSFDLK
jgi:hypothetical protein